MSELVIYRKYRPQNFSEVVGQEHIIKTLTSALNSGKVAHAYLFAGPIATAVSMIWNFIGYKFIVFDESKKIKNQK